MADGTEQSTVESVVPAFEKWLSHEEDKPDLETPPTQESPESEQPEEVEASTEQAETEGESTETENEQTDEAAEAPELSSLDPNLKVKVKIDGVDTEVTLDEALKGYSRTADYTRKTQEVAAQRKAFEAEQTAVASERQKYATYLSELEQAIKSTTPAEPDWAKLQSTLPPEEFAAEYARWQIHAREMGELKAEKERAQAAVVADQQKALEKHLEAEQVKLGEAIPEWKNAETAKTERAKIVAYAETAFGLTQSDLEKLVDHRPIVMLRKAMLWDEHQAKKPAVQARIETVRAATPGPSAAPKKQVSDVTKARERLAKTGKVEDAAAAFFKMLPD